jgi:hypothetical protein
VTNFSDEVAGLTRDLLRSMWAELGIDDAPRHHYWLAIDLEPLIVFTALTADSRLRERTLSWCEVNSRYVSMPRLTRFSSMLGQATAQSFTAYAAALKKHSQRVRLNVSPDLRRPSLIQLRLRALVGVTARAEALRLLLEDPNQSRNASAMVGPAGYGKAGLARALDMLTNAGITSARTEDTGVGYRLNRPSELAQALSGMPARFPDWAATFRVVAAILEYAKQTAAKAAVRLHAAMGAADQIRDEVARIPGASRPPRVTDEASTAAFERWARSFVAAQAGAQSASSNGQKKREVIYTVHRLLLGAWIATVKEEGDQPRPLALSDDPELRPERRAKRRLKLDDVGAAAEVIESILYDLRARELQRRRGSVVSREAVSDSNLPAMSREFASELLRPMHKGQAATFTEEFLEGWTANRPAGFIAAG